MSLGRATAAVIVLASPAWSQDRLQAEAPVELTPVTVRSPYRPPRDSSAASTVIDVTARQGEAATTASLVRAAPGVSTHDSGGGQMVTMSIRGSNASQVLVSLDGMPLNSVAGGGVDLSMIPAALLDRVQVVRGGVGAGYGGGALGGAVELSLRRVDSPAMAEAGIGSFGTEFATAAARGAIGTGNVMAAFHAERSDGDFPFPLSAAPQLEGSVPAWQRRENNDSKAASGLVRYSDRAPGGDVDLILLGNTLERGVPGLEQNPSLTDREASSFFGTVAQYRHAGVSQSFEGRVFGRGGVLDLSLATLGSAGVQHDGAAGGEAVNSWFLGSNRLDVGAFAAVEHIDSPWHGSHERPTAAISIADDFTWGPVTLVPAIRGEAVGPYVAPSYKLGAVVDLPWGFQARGNVGHSFRAPSLGELYLEEGTIRPNPDLQPEYANYGDLGIGLRSPHVAATAGAFFTRYIDMISYELFAPFRIRADNFSQAAVSGVEASAEVHVGPLAASAAYTYALSENVRDDVAYAGKELPYHPRHRLHSRLAFGGDTDSRFARVRAHVDVDAQSEQFWNRTSIGTVPGRVFVDAGAGYCLLPTLGLWAQAEVTNVFDVHTYDLIDYPIAGRAFLIVVRAAPGTAKGSAP